MRRSARQYFFHNFIFWRSRPVEDDGLKILHEENPRNCLILFAQPFEYYI